MDVFSVFGNTAGIILGLGVFGIALSGYAFAKKRDRFAVPIGIVANIAAFAQSSLAIVAALGHRIASEHAALGLPDTDRAPTLEVARAQSNELLILSFVFGLGVTALSIAAILRALLAEVHRAPVADGEAPDLAKISDAEFALPAFVTSGIALFSTAVTLMPLVLGSTPTGIPLDQASQKFREAERLLEGGDFAEGCAALELGLQKKKELGGPDLRSTRALVAACVDRELERAMGTEDPEARKRAFERLESFPLSDAERVRVEEVRGKLAVP